MIVVRKLYPAAYPRPIAIDKNKYTSSSGSLMGVLNQTIDKAPTKPKDRAREDFTINITKNTMVDKIGITVPI